LSRRPSPRAPLAVLASFFLPYRDRLAFVLGTALVTALLSACEPLLYKNIFDAVGAGEGALSSVVLPLVGLGIALLAREGLSMLLDVSVWRVRLAANFDILDATVDRLHALPLSHHEGEGVGAVMTKMERGISGVMTAFSEVAFQLLPALVYLASSAALMFHLDWRLALVVIAFAPLPAAIGARASKEQMDRERELIGRWTRLYARLNEVLSGIAVVKSFVREDDEKRRFLGGVRAANTRVVRGVATDARTTLAKNGAMACARVVAIGAGALLVLRHEITLGTLVAFLGYIAGVFQPVQTLTGMYQTLRKGAVSAEVVTSILDAHDSLADAPGAIELQDVEGTVRFENVSFAYREGTPILRGIDLHVRPGETIALVGASGSGKSTLLALLQRLYDVTDGCILVDGKDIRSFKQRSLRRRIGVVLQDGVLFDDSVKDNILFGRPGASQGDVEAAARAANAHDFILRLESGYETTVGERGAKLSGGERQRIAIARALLKDAPILILDEATSALDAESEDAVREALQRLRAGRTTFIIAHRLSTVTEADRIAVMQHGRIVEIGSHAQLLRSSGTYADLVARQTRGLVAA
jgi:ATP-binding cassette subfamily B protein